MTTLPTESDVRKRIPVTTGCLDYFPLAIAYVAMISHLGNEKHNPGQPLHWAREKSADHADCAGRHLLDRKTCDTDAGVLEAGQLAWRSLANLQLALEHLIKAGVDIWAPIRDNRHAVIEAHRARGETGPVPWEEPDDRRTTKHDPHTASEAERSASTLLRGARSRSV